jgi:hypothetical protein
MTAFESYQQFIHALYAPNDVIGIAFINPKSGAVQHTFVEASKAETREYFDALVSSNETFNIYAGMNPFKPELIGQNVGRTKDNVAAVKRVYVDADESGAQVVDNILKSGKVPAPTVVLESSPGKFQLIWNTEGLTRETAEPLMRALADEFHTRPLRRLPACYASRDSVTSSTSIRRKSSWSALTRKRTTTRLRFVLR